ncbi:MAG: hypothetical protein A2Z11_02395 [Candidatus Woykebacteria bacterium RBG_16_43_9]|uniref:Plasmid stabilization protein n=1 Tax=Candidatus Woykebacteria bacterium RBG_16_43_9 TaxID=1802596 RepID=A0A1G1WGG4_9BACT|nr:MAG: hypothetical protein A2Z11_02395 [Candidatus Woykebacteria bacterium RBG_16_43_9]
MYKVSLEKAAQKDFRKLDKQLKDNILDALKIISEDPLSGEPLKSGLSVYRSYHFTHQGTQYRIAYVLYSDINAVIIIMIGPRENFYERLKRRVVKR